MHAKNEMQVSEKANDTAVRSQIAFHLNQRTEMPPQRSVVEVTYETQNNKNDQGEKGPTSKIDSNRL